MRQFILALSALFFSFAVHAQEEPAIITSETQDTVIQTDALPQSNTQTNKLAQTPSHADLIIWGGTIYTANDNNPQVEAVAIQNGSFVFVGDRAGAAALQGRDTRIISLDGASLYPGFVDGHAHLAGIGERELSLNLEGTNSLQQLLATIKQWRDVHLNDPVLVGRGWIETHWPEARFPSRWDIDRIIADVPVILTRADGHALVTNSKALELAGITDTTAAPFGGDIIRNALGEATGVLIDTAQQLVWSLVPTPSNEDIANHLVTGSEVYARYGWTGLHNMSVPWAQVDMMEALSEEGEIGIRVYNSVVPEAAPQLFERGMSESANRRITTRAIKLYMDGALGSRGAALLAPYSDGETSGLILSSYEEILPLLNRALQDGIQINMHAIGDRANRQLLDWYEEAFANIPAEERTVAEPRWRDEHAQIINMQDILRFSALGIIPSMQPSHAIGDLHFAPARLGDDRLKGAYAWSTLIGSGAKIVGGSDAPVERGNPLIEFYAATARRDLNGFQGNNWHPEEALTRAEALKMFTIWPAIASFQEEKIGTIEVGKQADLTAFTVDLMTATESDIPKGKAVLTVVAGEILFEAGGEDMPEEKPALDDTVPRGTESRGTAAEEENTK